MVDRSLRPRFFGLPAAGLLLLAIFAGPFAVRVLTTQTSPPRANEALGAGPPFVGRRPVANCAYRVELSTAPRISSSAPVSAQRRRRSHALRR